MAASLLAASFLMGLAGGPHCAAMCGAACNALVARRDSPGTIVEWAERRIPRHPSRPLLSFQLGRLLGYCLAGAAAGATVESFAWLSSHTAALRPVWMLFHLAVLAWGLALIVLARQPAWVDSAGRAAWQRVRPLATARGGLVATGALWVFMPCGLLYSALLVASLAGGAPQGAAAMALFALGSGLALGLFPGVLSLLSAPGNGARKQWGTRAAGALLAGAAGWALWADLAHRIAQLCIPPGA
ncbi:MAG TPA: sulfite exporter TauE/SafE family protein [Ramlibacter sp.]|uniref:sulfite exporter TauE/SafE family protein n=1 Tax=Ramlibacter sp. TaxID=1917967 RepID=UPI002C1040D5|nr:sulfite exporter TauE/SafE family protein [Ramlibacter sp.]HVZ42812.1 sulfite exporter TauE/SafE family protein [Ramlibacter sp.]